MFQCSYKQGFDGDPGNIAIQVHMNRKPLVAAVIKQPFEIRDVYVTRNFLVFTSQQVSEKHDASFVRLLIVNLETFESSVRLFDLAFVGAASGMLLFGRLV